MNATGQITRRPTVGENVLDFPGSSVMHATGRITRRPTVGENVLDSPGSSVTHAELVELSNYQATHSW